MNELSCIMEGRYIELSENDDYLTLTNRVCYYNYPNLNSTILNYGESNEAKKRTLKKAQTLKMMPVQAKYKVTMNGEPTLGGHEAKLVNGKAEFGTASIGVHEDVWIEEEEVDCPDGEKRKLPCLYARSRIWKRYEKCIAAIRRLFENGELKSSWEINCTKYEFSNGIKNLIDYSFIGNCLLDGETNPPAYPNAAIVDIASQNLGELMVAEALACDIQNLKESEVNAMAKDADFEVLLAEEENKSEEEQSGCGDKKKELCDEEDSGCGKKKCAEDDEEKSEEDEAGCGKKKCAEDDEAGCGKKKCAETGDDPEDETPDDTSNDPADDEPGAGNDEPDPDDEEEEEEEDEEDDPQPIPDDDDEDEGKKTRTASVENSSLTERDLYRCLGEAVCKYAKEDWAFVSMIFPNEKLCWVKTDGCKAELDFMEAAYEVAGDAVTISSMNPIRLVASPRQMEKEMAEQKQKIADMAEEIASLSEIKKRYDSELAEQAKREHEAKVSELKAYAEKSGYFTQEEIASAEMSELFEKVDVASVKSLIADKVMEGRKIEVSTKAEPELATAKLGLSYDDNARKRSEQWNKFMGY